MPAGWLLCWLGFGPHGGIDRAAPLRWMLYPLLYGAWTLAHGAVAGWYPYPFHETSRARGYPAVLLTMALMALLFLALACVLRWVDGWLGTAPVEPNLIAVMPAEAGIHVCRLLGWRLAIERHGPRPSPG